MCSIGEFCLRCSRQFNVPCRHEWTHPNRNSAARWVRRDWTLIRFVIWISLPLSQRLKSTASNLWKCPPHFAARDRAVEVNGEIKVGGKCASKCSSDHNRAALTPVWSERYDWDHVNRADSRMNPATSATLLWRREINSCYGKPRERACGEREGIAVANIGVDAAIVIGVVVHIEESHTRRPSNDRREYGEDR